MTSTYIDELCEDKLSILDRVSLVEHLEGLLLGDSSVAHIHQEALEFLLTHPPTSVFVVRLEGSSQLYQMTFGVPEISWGLKFFFCSKESSY